MSAQLDPETIVGGQYKLIKSLGSGGMGSIFYGVHILTDQPVAVKLLHPTLCNDPIVRSRFLSEARTLAGLEHQNIVQWKNSIEEDGQLYLIMQFIEGENVEDRLEKRTKLPLDEAIPIVLQALSGLAYVHSKNIVHRDIKPSNILIRSDGEVKLADFGIAKFAGMPRHTQTGMTIGTYQYMSPEQVLGKELDARSDIYSMGITLFEMVTGKPPFDGETEFDICRQHLENNLPSIKRYDPRLPSRLNKILRKATAKRPRDRYQTAAEFMFALAHAFREHVTEIPPPWGLVGQVPKKQKGCVKSALWFLFWCSLLLVGGYFLYFYVMDPQEHPSIPNRHSIHRRSPTPSRGASRTQPATLIRHTTPPSRTSVRREASGTTRNGTKRRPAPSTRTPERPSARQPATLTQYNDTFQNNSLGWPVGQHGGATLHWARGSYTIQTRSEGRHQTPICPEQLGKYQAPLTVTLQAQVQKNDPSGHAIFGINLFNNPQQSQALGYYIAINPPNQLLTLARLDQKRWHYMLPWKSTTALRTKGSNLLQVTIQNKQLFVRINGKSIVRLPVSKYNQGRICLFVQQGGAQVTFERFSFAQEKAR